MNNSQPIIQLDQGRWKSWGVENLRQYDMIQRLKAFNNSTSVLEL